MIQTTVIQNSSSPLGDNTSKKLGGQLTSYETLEWKRADHMERIGMSEGFELDPPANEKHGYVYPS